LKIEYDSWMNERQMQTIKEKVDTSKAMDASSVDTESSRMESKEHDTSSISGNDAHDDVADIRPIYDEEPMAEVQTTAEINVFAIRQQHTEQPEFNNEGKVDQNAKEYHDTWKLMSQPLRNQSVVRQPTAFKSERPRFSKPRISSKNMPRFTLNDMVHNHYLEEAKKKTQERSRNSEPSLMPFARSKCTANGSKPMPRRNTQKFRNWPASKNSFVMTKTVPIAEHSRNSRNFFNSEHFVCSTCQKCVFSANHDSCVTKFLKEVNSCAKVPSNKTLKRDKPIEQISVPNTHERQIPKGHRFSIPKTSIVQKKTMTPRSCLRWKPTGKIFKTVGLRWVPTGKVLAFSITKVDSEPLNGSNAYITNKNECEQTLDVSTELGIHDHNNEPSSSKLVSNVVPPACKSATS
nr:hypothetical protein [Tanacetum cinerariifolium]